MNIVIVSHYFWPENFIINDIAAKLVQAGNKVTVFTGKPNYPDGEIYDGYRFWGIEKKHHNGIDIVHVPLIPRGKGGIVKLTLNYVSFIFFGSLMFPIIVRQTNPDVILFFAMSPVTSAIPAIILKYTTSKKLYLWLQDLWPESLSATGYVKNQLALSIIEKIIKWIYRNTDKILIQSEAFRKSVNLSMEKNRIIYFPNSVDGTSYEKLLHTELPDNFKLFRESGECFNIIFAGNIGKAQSIETIISAADILSREAMKINFILLGSGSRLNWAKNEVRQLKLSNVHFPGRFPTKDMPSLLSCADVLLVTLKNEPIFSYTIPSKVQAYLAVGKPIIASLNGEGARIIVEEANAGIACPAEDATALADAVVTIYEMSSEERAILGANGRRYFDDNFDMDLLVKKLIDIFNQ